MNQTFPSITSEKMASIILTVRNQRVILDSDLAKIYGVETRALNQAVKRNLDKFPDDFMFDLNRDEILRISQTVTSSGKLKFSKQVRAFTEHGALQLRLVFMSKKMPRHIAREENQFRRHEQNAR